MQVLVQRLGDRFSHKGTGHDLWYFSPLRPDEKTASFKIDQSKNTWYDFARTQGVDAHGDTLIFGQTSTISHDAMGMQ